MIKNYFVVAWRMLLKNKLFSIINIAGLSLSMSVGLIVLVRLVDSLQYDTFHPDPERIFRIISTIDDGKGNHFEFASTPLPLAGQLEKETEAFESVTQLYPSINNTATSDGIKEFQVRGAFTNNSFLKVFGFTLKEGSASDALSKPNSAIITAATAERFFQKTSALGKTITLESLGDFEITGILHPSATKSHINYDIYISSQAIPLLEKERKLPPRYETWDSFEHGYTYVKLARGVGNHRIKSALLPIEAEINQKATQGSFGFASQNISAITPSQSDLIHEIGRGPTRGSLLAEGGIVLLILIAAAFNYTNLSVARALSRGKEVGIRKLAGAQRWQIFAQYIIEAIILAFAALFLANIILGFILEYKPFNDGYEMVPEVNINMKLLFIFTIFCVFVGILAGSMPAWLLSSFKPARVLRNVGSEKLMGGISFRKALIVFQFTLSLVIIIFLSAFYHQFDFIARGDTGVTQRNVLIIPASSDQHTLEATVGNIPGIIQTGLASDVVGVGITGSVKTSLTQHDRSATPFQYFYGDNNSINIMEIQLIAGTLFKEENKIDHQVIVNEKSCLALGLTNLKDAPGTILYLQDSVKALVVGVIKDFYSNGYGNPIQPLLIRYSPDQFRYIIAKVQNENTELIKAVEATGKKLYGDNSYACYWLNKKLDDGNNQFAEISLLGFLAFMTVTIATMGLLGLVVYTVETRRKEISIRKIVGASGLQLMTLLSRGFLNQLIIAGIVGIPLGVFLSGQFLNGFANKIQFDMSDGILCFMFLLLIGSITILSQTASASAENPAKNLRND